MASASLTIYLEQQLDNENRQLLSICSLLLLSVFPDMLYDMKMEWLSRLVIHNWSKFLKNYSPGILSLVQNRNDCNWYGITVLLL